MRGLPVDISDGLVPSHSVVLVTTRGKMGGGLSLLTECRASYLENARQE